MRPRLATRNLNLGNLFVLIYVNAAAFFNYSVVFIRYVAHKADLNTLHDYMTSRSVNNSGYICWLKPSKEDDAGLLLNKKPDLLVSKEALQAAIASINGTVEIFEVVDASSGEEDNSAAVVIHRFVELC